MFTSYRCPSCKRGFSIFRWTRYCDSCRYVLCSDCLKSVQNFRYLCIDKIPKGRFCADCYNKFAEPVISNYNRAVNDYQRIDLWPSTYKGRINVLNDSEPIPLSTNWFRERDDCEKSARVTATYLNYDAVIEFKLEKDTNSEPGSGKGTHYYTIWKAEFLAVKLDHSR